MFQKINKIAKNKILLYILAGSFVVSTAYSFIFKINPVVDAKAYDRIAQNIVAGNGFVEDARLNIKFDKAIIRVGPLYQYFLAGVYLVFGHHYWVVWVVQALLHTISAYFVYLSAKILFKKEEKAESAALVAAGIFALSPDLIEISAMLMTETLYLFFWTWLVWYFLDFADKNKIKDAKAWLGAVFLGVIGGLAVMARPPVLFVLPIILIYFLSKKKIGLIILMLFAMGVIFSPWTIRNYFVFERVMPFGAAGNYNFWIGNHEGASGEQETGPEIKNFFAENGAISLYDNSVPKFKEFVLASPFEFARLTFLRVNRYFSVARPMGFWFYDSGVSQFIFILSSALTSLILFVFGLFGIIKIWKYKDALINYFLWIIALTPLILFITVVETRYRFQIYPLLAIFAGYGICNIFDKKALLNRALWISVFIVLLNTALDLFLSFNKFLDKLGLFFHL